MKCPISLDYNTADALNGNIRLHDEQKTELSPTTCARRRKSAASHPVLILVCLSTHALLFDSILRFECKDLGTIGVATDHLFKRDMT
jgi:hypothetical protein